MIIIIPLIVPYGIEIHDTGLIKFSLNRPLIVPYGIEIPEADFSVTG